MTPAEFARSLQRKAARLEREVMAAERQTLKEAQAEAVRRSSGSVPLATLRRLRPYSRRVPNTGFDPGQMSVRSGLLRRSWVMDQPQITGGKIVSRLRNTSPEAKYMPGTKFMVPRTVGANVREKVQARRLRRLSAAVKRALKG